MTKLSIEEVIESGEKFDNAKIYLSRAAIQSQSGLVI
jgi:hypothetical protein